MLYSEAFLQDRAIALRQAMMIFALVLLLIAAEITGPLTFMATIMALKDKRFDRVGASPEMERGRCILVWRR